MRCARPSTPQASAPAKPIDLQLRLTSETNPFDREAGGAPSVSACVSLPGALQAQAAGGALLGLGVAALTVRLDHELARHGSDVWTLLGWGAGLYALGWLLLALLPTALLVWVSRRAQQGPVRRLADAARHGLALAPVLYLALLPQVGLAGHLLSSALFARGARRVLAVLVAALVCLGLGLVAERLDHRRRRRIAQGRNAVRWLPVAVALAAAGLVLAALAVRPPASGGPAATDALGSLDFESGVLPVAASSTDEAPAPLVLLCIDGADPEVMGQLMARGELPTFRRLAQEGVWGELATLRPTLSPVVWTTLITGRAPEDHGIHQFVHFRLPGVRAPILQFPLHSGLNFTLLQRIEDATGSSLRSPYTTAMRRVQALWNIVGRTHTVGVYRWLMTWPAEEVNGYFVSGGIAWAKLQPRRGRTYHPEALRRQLSSPLPVPTDEEIEAHLGFLPEAESSLHRQILGALRDPTVGELARLTEAYDPRFTAASFFQVDASQHLFGHLHGTDDPRAGAVHGFYRLADARLGELLDLLDAEARILVVSDHGYDFAHGHHGNQPAGVFFARGEGLARGVEAEGLQVYDVAPLALRLLDLPLADDMPGTAAGRYRRVLDPQWADAHPERRIATWEDDALWRGRRQRDVERLVDPEVEEVLRSLGYVE